MASIPGDLVDSLRDGRVRLFVGSGVSCAAGLISWADLVAQMKDVIRRENTTFARQELESFLAAADHLDVADVFRDTVKEHRYFRFLRSHFRRPVGLSSLHRTLTRLPARTVFTTNYDKLLETAFRRASGADPAVIVYPAQLGYIDDGEVRIVKLHGDIDHPPSIVLTRGDYATYASRHREFENQFHSSVNDYTMLFVGFGLQDPNFRRIYEDARQFYDSTKRLAYAIMVSTNIIERTIWDGFGLRIIPLDKHSQVPGYLDNLRKALTVTAP